VREVDVLDGDAAAAITRALDWPATPLLRARVSTTADGSAKPSEVARALGVWGADDPRAEHAKVARLGVVAVSGTGTGAVTAAATATATATATGSDN
jgi:hypothetical protein